MYLILKVLLLLVSLHELSLHNPQIVTKRAYFF